MAGVQQPLLSAVSPDFPNGLHRQFLTYLSAKLNREMTVSLMPFARRLKAIENGDIDIMVGIQSNRQIKNGILLQPAYEVLHHTIFVDKAFSPPLNNKSDLKLHQIAITRVGSYGSVLQKIPEANLVEVESVDQKIALLQLHRITAFIHFKDSALLALNTVSNTGNIIVAPFQPLATDSYHIVISKKGALKDSADKLVEIIQTGIANGDFSRIRRDYYANIPQQEADGRGE
jgi:ABC-type amino acid transport substrate-binding protein